jgi:hypothetical protein
MKTKGIGREKGIMIQNSVSNIFWPLGSGARAALPLPHLTENNKL